tara:strand:- start:988 stop:1530 length:543 start_codon:yes stop_codon:yes gene_type:complete
MHIASIAAFVQSAKNVTKEINSLMGKREVHNLSAYAMTALEVVIRDLVTKKRPGRKSDAGELRDDLVSAGVKKDLAKRLGENAVKMMRLPEFAECTELEDFQAVYEELEIASQNDLLVHLGSVEPKLTDWEKIEKIFRNQDGEEQGIIISKLEQVRAEMAADAEESEDSEDAATDEQIAA